jgi:tetratricopeptide (TPR) repeat protein
VTLLERALDELHRGGRVLPVRAVNNALAVYTRAGQHDKALALLGSADISLPSYQESISKSKVLRFYDATLFSNLAALYQAAGEQQMERARSDARLKGLAGYFLADSHFSHGSADKAAAELAQLAGAGELPPVYRERVAMLQAAVDVLGKQAQKGNTEFGVLTAKYGQDPSLLGELLMICLQARARCSVTAGTAQTLASTGQGERFRGLHRAIGMMHAEAGRRERALLFLETARDKSNKNRIDTNDPLLLVQLADLYMATKSYSENLEIYFELSKEFPAVRQLQETGQGIYSMEYRSAGDVKIF